MKLIVGLGNPGTKYEKTRHNIGFQIIEKYISEKNLSGAKNKFQSKFIKEKLNGEKVFFIMPQTFMNLSGDAVGEIVNYYNISPNNVTIIYDDLDLPLGKIRIKKKGGSGGHNGIKSIISHIGNDFIRLRCGIGRPQGQIDVANYVLSKFTDTEKIKVKKMTEEAVNVIEEIIKDKKITNIMNQYN
ncbi:MAG: aminoacyl-tRNA hydrolase [Fusobacteriota bacterium]